MKRDLDLIRSIMLDIEAYSDPITQMYSYPQCTPAELQHAMHLMLDNGLVEAKSFSPLNGPKTFYLVRLTWAGSDFLDTVRSDEIWEKAKAGAAKAKGFTFDMLKRLAAGLIETQLEKYTGVKLGD